MFETNLVTGYCNGALQRGLAFISYRELTSATPLLHCSLQMCVSTLLFTFVRPVEELPSDRKTDELVKVENKLMNKK